MVKIFEAKVSVVMLIIVFLVVAAVPLLDTGYTDWTIMRWITSSVLLFIFLYTVYASYNTSYEITNETLILISKPFYRKEIAVNTIKKIERSNSFMSSPAPSFDRLEIHFGKFDSILVSPKDKVGFAKALQEIKPSIRVKL
jgi:hypothetical protein